MSTYSPDVRQFHKAKQADTFRHAKHMQRHQQAARPVAQCHFDKSRLPNPAHYYEAQGIKLTGKGAWRDAVCPFHDDSKPSLRVKIETGAFSCMACGAHGGDVLAFHMQRHGATFRAACMALGAWIGGTK